MDYEYLINDDNSFVILFHGEEIHKSRQFRLKVQAERKAQDWIQRELGTPPGDITLDIQKVTVDPNFLFGGKHG